MNFCFSSLPTASAARESRREYGSPRPSGLPSLPPAARTSAGSSFSPGPAGTLLLLLRSVKRFTLRHWERERIDHGCDLSML